MRCNAESILSTLRIVGECLPDSNREIVSCRTPASRANSCCEIPSERRCSMILRAIETRAYSTAGRLPLASGFGNAGRPAHEGDIFLSLSPPPTKNSASAGRTTTGQVDRHHGLLITNAKTDQILSAKVEYLSRYFLKYQFSAVDFHARELKYAVLAWTENDDCRAHAKLESRFVPETRPFHGR